jgi:hypothetical protein
MTVGARPLIKEIVTASEGKNGTCIIRASNYCHSLAHFLNLVEVAKKDYPDIAMSDVSIEKYGGDRFKRTWAIEFPTSDTEPKTGWTKIK